MDLVSVGGTMTTTPYAHAIEKTIACMLQKCTYVARAITTVTVLLPPPPR